MVPRRYKREKLFKPIRLAELMDQRTRRWRFAHLAKLEAIRAKWPEAAGDYVAAHVQPARLVRKQLRLAADDAAWVSEITYLAPDILARLTELLPGEWVEELKVVPGEPMPEVEPPEPDQIELAEETEEMRRAADEAAAELEDEVLAAAVRRATLARLRRLDARPAATLEPDHASESDDPEDT